MAIKTKNYSFLWQDVLDRKGQHLDFTLNKFLSFYDSYNNASDDQKDKMKWIFYRLDQDLRSFIFKYIEVIEKSFQSLLVEKHSHKILREKLNFTNSICAVTRKCSKDILNEIDLFFVKKLYLTTPISINHIKKRQKQMHIFQGGIFIPSNTTFSNINQFRNKVQHFNFILPYILSPKRKIFKNFIDVFNIHYRHSFALNFLAVLLKRMTTDLDEISIDIIEKLHWLFALTDDISKNNEWIKVTKDYHNCMLKGFDGTDSLNQIIYKDFYSEADILFKDEGKSSNLYKKRRKLSGEIEHYKNNYINYTTICYRKPISK